MKMKEKNSYLIAINWSQKALVLMSVPHKWFKSYILILFHMQISRVKQRISIFRNSIADGYKPMINDKYESSKKHLKKEFLDVVPDILALS